VNGWKVIFATLVIFGAGLVVGGMVGHHTAQLDSTPPPKTQNFQNSNPSQVRLHELLRRMDKELELTPDQHEHIEKIIAASQDHTQKLWAPIAQEMHKETVKVCEAIREELTPDQRKKFDSFARRQGERRKARPGANGPSGADLTNAVPAGAQTNQF
jgi:Spy/CpxP family protein refolding chaperone